MVPEARIREVERGSLYLQAIEQRRRSPQFSVSTKQNLITTTLAALATMLTMMRTSTPALFRSSASHLVPAAALVPAARRLRTVTRFREEGRPETKEYEEQQRHKHEAAQQQQQQQAGVEQAREGEQQQSPGPQSSSQMARRGGGEGGQLQGQRGDRDLMLPPSFRRFNETLGQMQREMDMVMNQFFGDDMLHPFPFDRAFGGMGFPSLVSPLSPPELLRGDMPHALIHMDFHEDDKQYALTAEVPGFSKDHVSASLSPEGVLTLKGELKEDSSEGDGKTRMARFTSFQRSFRLPKDADLEGVHVSVKDGVAQVTVPKHAKKQQHHREIPVK